MSQRDDTAIVQVLREFALTLVRTAPQTGLSRTAAGTLSRLDRLGPQRITTLASSEVVTQPAMTGLIQRLESTGLVQRQPDEADGRATLIAITTKGRSALSERRRQHDDAIAARIATLEPKQRALIEAALPAITTLTEIA